jgi:hypothetical protein
VPYASTPVFFMMPESKGQNALCLHKKRFDFETNIFFYHNMKKFALQLERNKEIGCKPEK